MISFSPSTGSFYDLDLHGSAIPADAIAVSDELHRRLVAGRAAGHTIVLDKRGAPKLDRLHGPSLAERRASTIASIKAEAARRIEVAAPMWRQLNALRSGDGAADPLFARIDAIRTASNDIEAAAAKMAAADLARFDPSDPAHWPLPA